MIIKITDYAPKGDIWTASFSAALAALHQAGGGVLWVSAGHYPTGPIELFSDIELHLEPGAFVQFVEDIAAYPLKACQFEGKTEERPSPCLSAYGAHNVSVTGSGTLDGGGAMWWTGHREKTLPHGRPYLLHFEDCCTLRIAGVRLQNSPAWTVHPLRCQDVIVEGITIKNPYDSPNTDGINPESCRHVRIVNCCVDVGDDCITLKAGTEQTTTPPPCENIVIANCCLVHGHGGIVIGSEMSGCVRNVAVTNCIFTGTDRGIRVKTRRRRSGTVENLTFDNLIMENVFCPFVFNMYYSCGTAEKDRWVWEKVPYPVGENTPVFRNIRISHVTVTGACAAAGFLYGLPESPIRNLAISDCLIQMDSAAPAQCPAMMGGLDPMSAQGFFLRNIQGLRISGVQVEGAAGALYNADASVAKFTIVE
jgi:galacturan 1,4-alpha-galacturonidase